MPLDAASDATRQVCPVGRDALFRGDAGLAPSGSHYLEGTVWCDGVNLGVYLRESGLAITDPAECGLARSEWLVSYCHPGREPPPDGEDPAARDPAGVADDASAPSPDDTVAGRCPAGRCRAR